MNTFLNLAAAAALAGLCMAPSDCDDPPTTSDAGDATAEAGADPGTGPAPSKTPRQVQSSKDCEKRGACSKANGRAFSNTECENNNTIDGERADSLACNTQFDAYLSCVAAINYDCSRTLDIQIQAACNSQYQAYGTCLSNPPN